MNTSEDLQSSCSIGNADHSECHLTTYCPNKGLKPLQEFSAQQQLISRSGICLEDKANICFHHEALLLDRYEFLQRSCCNPFNKKNHAVRKSLRPLSLETADQLKEMKKSDIKPGQKTCASCRKEFSIRKSRQSQSSISQSDDEDDKTHMIETLNTSLTAVGISPLKFRRLTARDTKSYAKRKICETQEVIVKKIAGAGGFEPDEFNQPSTSKQCTDCMDYKKLIEELKEKLQVSKRQEKIQILTMAPQSWTIKQTMKEFGVTERMVKAARKLKAEAGILALPKNKIGKTIPESIKQKVMKLYQDPEFSRICPGKKDYVSVRINGAKVQMQKYLLLSNLREMFTAYRDRNGLEIGFSKFCELRPKWCITVGASGSHSVCVCTIHQNVKLMLANSPINDDYKELMSKTVCNMESKDCMLHRCEACPGNAPLKEFLEKVFEENDPEDTIEFKQWVHTDRDTLETKQKTIEEFIEELVTKISALSIHHFISKHQSKHLKLTKEGLNPKELAILMDFSENYSFVVQDAAQGFRWENSQATLHPFVVYYKDELEIKSISYCIISDCLRHDTIAVHVFLTKLIECLKRTFTEIDKIHYFSDGSAAQYKNYKNFLNLCHHQSDFAISAEWNFFGTSHGKSPCDGIGGTIKRLAAKASLQRPIENQILTPSDLHEFSIKSVSGIEFIFISKEEIETARVSQEERFKNGCTVSGTRENHQFVPINTKQIRISRVSNDAMFFTADVDKSGKIIHQGVVIADLQPGQYVACIYDNKRWIGNICEVSAEENDALINFMHPQGPVRSFYWPARQDICWIPAQHIITILPVPTAITLGRQYSLPESTMAIISNKFQELKQ